MKERPILFSAPMVRALLDGRKTQTRRLIKPQPVSDALFVDRGVRDVDPLIRCPYGQPGDRLWVRETHAYVCGDVRGRQLFSAKEKQIHFDGGDEDAFTVRYASDEGISWEPQRWRPSIHMPRWASRITLEVTGVRVERLFNITEEDAKAEGVVSAPTTIWESPQIVRQENTYKSGFLKLWNSIHGGDSFQRFPSPWVWVVEFRRMEK